MESTANPTHFLTNFVAMHRERLVEAYGDNRQWAEVRSSYEVAEQGDRQRELRDCLAEVAAYARARLPADAAGAAELNQHLDDLIDDTLEEVKPAPKTGATAGLGAIFANATANVSWWKKQSSRRVGATFTSDCRTCGAAQETALLFECEYCGSFLYGDFREEYDQ